MRLSVRLCNLRTDCANMQNVRALCASFIWSDPCEEASTEHNYRCRLQSAFLTLLRTDNAVPDHAVLCCVLH